MFDNDSYVFVLIEHNKRTDRVDEKRLFYVVFVIVRPTNYRIYSIVYSSRAYHVVCFHNYVRRAHVCVYRMYILHVYSYVHGNERGAYTHTNDTIMGH